MKEHLKNRLLVFTLFVLFILIPQMSTGQDCSEEEWISLQVYGMGAWDQVQKIGTFKFCPNGGEATDIIIVAGAVRVKNVSLSVTGPNQGTLIGTVEIGEPDHTLVKYEINVSFSGPPKEEMIPASGTWQETWYTSVSQGSQEWQRLDKPVTGVSLSGGVLRSSSTTPAKKKKVSAQQKQPQTLKPLKQDVFYCEILDVQPYGLRVQVKGQAYGGSGTYSYSWDFGEGAPSPSSSPSEQYTYLCPGLYRVRLVVQDLTMHQECYCDQKILVASPHFYVEGDIEAAPIQGKFPDPFDDYYVIFTAPQPSGGVPPYQYHWDFGDNRNHIPDTLGTPITHFFWNVGTYIVSLTISDSCGQTIPPLKKVVDIKNLVPTTSSSTPSGSPDSWIGKWDVLSLYPNAPGPKSFPWWFEIFKENGEYKIRSHTTDPMEILSISKTSLIFRFDDMFQTLVEITLQPGGKCKGTVKQPKNQPDYLEGIVQGEKQK